MRFPFAAFLARTLPHLAVLALMLVTLAPQSTAFWQCEGQKCGVAPWVCCCVAPTPLEDALCSAAGAHFTGDDHASEVVRCEVDCHCSVVVQSGSPSLHSAPHYFAPPVFVISAVQFAPEVSAPVVVATPVAAPSRGPPLRPVYLASAFLRGPPLA